MEFFTTGSRKTWSLQQQLQNGVIQQQYLIQNPSFFDPNHDRDADESAVSTDHVVNANDLQAKSEFADTLHHAGRRDAGAAAFEICEPFRHLL